MNYKDIIRNNNFFSHFSNDHLDEIIGNSEIISLEYNESIHIKNDDSLYFIISGLITEQDNIGRVNSVFYSNGSSLGALPFSLNKCNITLKSIDKSKILKIRNKTILNTFLNDFRLFQAYVKSLNETCTALNKTAEIYNKVNTKIITVFSDKEKTGKTTFASSLGLKLSQNYKTLLIDLSYKGKSVFECFNKIIHPPLSIKEQNSNGIDFKNSIESINENLDLLNLLNTSNIKFSPKILSPLLFKLALKYNRIIIDCGFNKSEEVIEIFNQSSVIINIDNEKNKNYRIIDDNVNRFQKVINIEFLEEFKNNNNNNFIKLNKVYIKDENITVIKTISDSDTMQNVVDRINMRNKVLYLLNRSPEAIFYKHYLDKNEILSNYDIIYAEGYSLLIVSIYLLSKIKNISFKKNIINAFKLERINSLLTPIFPESAIFTNEKFLKYNNELFRNNRNQFSNLSVITSFYQNNIYSGKSSGSLSNFCTFGNLFENIFENYQDRKNCYYNNKTSMNLLNYLDCEQLTMLDIKSDLSKTYYKKVNNLYKNYIFDQDHNLNFCCANKNFISREYFSDNTEIVNILENSKDIWNEIV